MKHKFKILSFLVLALVIFTWMIVGNLIATTLFSLVGWKLYTIIAIVLLIIVVLFVPARVWEKIFGG